MTRPDPRPDLHAAHSMDTRWFAVDDAGEVHVMDSGENGAVPGAPDEQDSRRLTHAILALAHRHHLDALPAPDDACARPVVRVAADTPCPPGFIALAPDLWITNRLDRDGLVALAARPGVELIRDVSDLDASTFRGSDEAPMVYTRAPLPSEPAPVYWEDLPATLRQATIARLPRALRGVDLVDLLEHFRAPDLTFWGDPEDMLRENLAGRDEADLPPPLALAVRRYAIDEGNPDDPELTWNLYGAPPSPGSVGVHPDVPRRAPPTAPAAEPGRIEVHAAAAPWITAAMATSGVAWLRELTFIGNTAPCDVEMLITTSPAVTAPYRRRLRVDGRTPVADLPTAVAGPCSLRVSARWTVSVLGADGAELGAASGEVERLPDDYWTGPAWLPELLAAHVLPDDAARALATAVGGAVTGRDRHRARRLTAEVVDAVAARITSVSPSLTTRPRPLATPTEVLAAGTGDPLAWAIVLTSALEAAGLPTVLALTDTDAIVGVWLDGDGLQGAVHDDPEPLLRRLDLGELSAFAMSGLANGATAAADLARAALADPATFTVAVDIAAARNAGVRPRTEDPTAPARAWDPVGDAAEAGPRTRLDRWKEKLLDLSLRNRLLNFRPGASAIRLEGGGIASIAAALAAGDTLEFAPRQAEGAAAAGLHTEYTPKELESRLTELYRASRSSLEESGAVTLYAALGVLFWTEEPDGPERMAPIVLVPCALERSGPARRPRLTAAEDEVRANVTLLKKLETDFGLDVRGMDTLPETDTGAVDITAVLHHWRKLIADRPGWRVSDDCWLALFSFSKFLMWLDLQARTEHLTRNPVVEHLLHGKGKAFSLAAPLVDEQAVDDARPPSEMFTVVDADPSQLSAILAAEAGSSFVLQGPPGTGKSQTITNLIAQLLANGKTVLFVSEKRAALEVVHHRLSRVGLAPFCLELHAHEANKRAVMKQLEASFVSANAAPKWAETSAALAEARRALGAYAAGLATPLSTGLTPWETLGRLLTLRDTPLRDTPLPADPGVVSGETFQRWLTSLRRLNTVVARAGGRKGNPWLAAGSPLRRRTWSAGGQRELLRRLQALRAALVAASTEAPAIATALGLPPIRTPGQLRALAQLAAAVERRAAIPVALLKLPPDQAYKQVEPTLTLVRARQAAWRGLAPVFGVGLLELDLADLHARYERWQHRFFLFAFFALWGARSLLRRVAHGPLPDVAGVTALLETALEVRTQDERLGRTSGPASALLGPLWAGADTDPQAAHAALHDAAALRQACLALTDAWGDDALGPRWLARVADEPERLAQDTPLGRSLTAAAARANALDAARADAATELGCDDATVDDGGQASIADLVAWIDHALSRPDAVQGACDVREAEAGLTDLGLAAVLAELRAGVLRDADAEAVIERQTLQGAWEALCDRDPTFGGFRHEDHESAIQRFQQLDLEHQQLARHALVARLAARLPDPNGPGEELGFLRRQLQLQRAHAPVRKLFAQIRGILDRLKPCAMMSPLSVAQFLDPSLPAYDVVVFDEASQIPPWDAIGAIARGRQVIIVGDSKQLPPTSFFAHDAAPDEAAFDEEDLRDVESVLEEAVSSGLRELRLRWHYRSRHESLIAFSNRQYYDGRLYTFPSADAAPGARGVRLVPVPEGSYDRGRSRSNRAEAERLVMDLEARLTSETASHSIGVVTFSLAQQRLVEDLVDQLRARRPDLDAWFGAAAAEPVFIKNLENVQGDERDVMLFSIGYGPDAQGRVAHNFGALNRQGGERRLNVAITRARDELVVYSTLRADHIDLGRTRAVGVAHLKAFLDYAERGVTALDAQVGAPRAQVESPLEAEVRSAIEAMGYTVHAQVGCSGYRVDLAVQHPEQPGRYLCGVECDGAAYHHTRVARERDRLRQQVLEGLGWRIIRVWSTSWWEQRERSIERLKSEIEAAFVAAPAPAPTRDASREAPASTMPMTAPAPADASPVRPPTATPWAPRAPAAAGVGDEIHTQANRRVVASQLTSIIAANAPIHVDDAARLVLESWSISRFGPRLRDLLDGLIAADPAIARHGDWLWVAGTDRSTWSGIRLHDDPELARPITRIPTEEIRNAARWVLSRAITLDRDTLINEVLSVFGVLRRTAPAVAAVGSAIDDAADRGELKRAGERFVDAR